MRQRQHKRQVYRRLRALPLALMKTSRMLDEIGAGSRRQMYFTLAPGRRRPKPAAFWQYMMWSKAIGFPSLTIGRSRAGRYHVSTIFLGLNHGYGDFPVLFETMAWSYAPGAKPGGQRIWHDEQRRYRTWAEAIAGHRALVAQLSNEGRSKK